MKYKRQEEIEKICIKYKCKQEIEKICIKYKHQQRRVHIVKNWILKVLFSKYY